MSSNIDNLYARDGFWWWVGVVEDRLDPLKLGRCRVRIMGYHADNQSIPTEDLPWAMPMTPILSAAVSGKGETPLGPLEGTWVMGFFADGAECQQPVMMGTVGGFPTTSISCTIRQEQAQRISNVQKDVNGNVVRDQTGAALPAQAQNVEPENTTSLSIYATLPPLDQSNIQAIMDSIAVRESSSVTGGAQNYTVVNDLGYVGKYQFGAAALQTLGYIRTPITKTKLKNSDMETAGLWTGKNGINSLDDFKANKNNVQEIAMFENLKSNYVELQRKGIIDASASTKSDVAGYLSTAHLLGAGGARDLANGVTKTDALGTSGREYFNLGVVAVGGIPEFPVQTAALSSAINSINDIAESFKAWTGVLNNPKLGKPDPFTDPNSVYPKCEYTARADTNKLATRNDELDSTPIPEKDKNRITGIATANDAGGENNGVWDEPPSAYNARYPYNHVKETESGHVIELDDTPNAERIHIYHRTGTYVEIDRNGSVRYKVKGENYEIYNRNNHVYVQGNADVTVDGSKTLLVKNTLDVEVLGKTTINIKDHCDVNISGDLNLKARNINLEAQQSFNLKSGTQMVQTVGTDLDITAYGDENHKVYGDFAVDAQDIFLNSGFGAPSISGGSGLLNGIQSSLFGSVNSGFDITGLNPFNGDLSNPFNVVGKSLSGILGKSLGGGAVLGVGPVLGGLGLGGAATGVASGLTGGVSLGGLGLGGAATGTPTGFGGLGGLISSGAGIFTSGGLGGLISNVGVPGLDTVMKSAGVGDFYSVLQKSGLSDSYGLSNILSAAKLPEINNILGNRGLPSLESILTNAGLSLPSQVGLGSLQQSMFNALKQSEYVPAADLEAGQNLIKAFENYGSNRVSAELPRLINSVPVTNEFSDWVSFPDSAQLSKHFTLGDLSNRVSEVQMQTPIISQGGQTKNDIAYNLKSLSVNSLDPIKDKYADMYVSDAFRPSTAYLISIEPTNPVAKMIDSIKSNVSSDAAAAVERELEEQGPAQQGRSANLQFKGIKPKDYYDRAVWIRDNVAYDQLRLEYSTVGNAEPWISISHSATGNRPAASPDKVVTVVNGQIVANYLVDMTDLKSA